LCNTQYQKIAPERIPRVKDDYFSSFNPRHQYSLVISLPFLAPLGTSLIQARLVLKVEMTTGHFLFKDSSSFEVTFPPLNYKK